MIVLGIETSCDDTAAAIIKDVQCLSSIVFSQDSVHAEYGGVVPELASRNHIKNIFPAVRKSMEDAGVTVEDLDGIAATFGPGLIGSLLVGLEFAKALAKSKEIPFVAVNHLDGHLSAVHLLKRPVPYPHLGLVISGGHTSIFRVSGPGDYKLLGATRDDAAGEAFDKAAKMLGLGYPGGYKIAALAAKGDKHAIKLIRDIPLKGSLDFSFSGLKSAFRRHIEKNGIPTGRGIEDLAASFQGAVIDAILYRVRLAIGQEAPRAIVATGGVAANKELRTALTDVAKETKIDILLPPPDLCTDNAAMVAVAGKRKLERHELSSLEIEASARALL
ncbi:MAG: tRNA (adenosine(37)-N6)-threonylcarbamoyltransferase complex transferase subunit TsaD [Deltaproteobacteria bacterium]|nr:tRNA (adenosine(37)-N6)-threonylcarbamoyltransferase complex transferase subunit TsaD [Deltaproteobacteria bacterium]